MSALIKFLEKSTTRSPAWKVNDFAREESAANQPRRSGCNASYRAVSLPQAGVVVGSTGSLIRFPSIVGRYHVTLLSPSVACQPWMLGWPGRDLNRTVRIR